MVARASVVGLLRISPGAFDASASSDRSVEFGSGLRRIRCSHWFWATGSGLGLESRLENEQHRHLGDTDHRLGLA
jgi:hypothetical protein